ncbi:MAG: ABC transporter ATP-binding protein [Anaerolineae bacterium]|nr:ABC transporter ATP-binding protein [Anaerolineae bacterium]MDW8097883.1 ABC transporter ATP-binding protein [Anaerolineae bacterium]
MKKDEALLSVQNLTTIFESAGGLFSRRQVIAVDDISFSLPGDRPVLLTVVGESGSGKTTLARNILGLTRPTRGTILYRGRDLYKMSQAEWFAYRREVQPVFQDPYATYNPFYKIDRVLEIPIRKFRLASSKQEAQALIEEALQAVDLRPADVLGRYPHQLSGGERQRVMLARVYLMRPRLIVADEPISMIDAALRALFLNILLDFRDRHGISCIFITHNLATAYYLGGEIMVMCRGRLIERGDMDTVIARPAHPYTQLLVESVPAKNPRERWTVKRGAEAIEASELRVGQDTCVFLSRCPHAMDICHQRRPALLPVGDDQEAACFLYGV